MDIHSAVGDILFNWGDDNDQVTDPSIQFLNPAWDGKRGLFSDAYREWIDEGDFGRVSNAANRVARAMQSKRSTCRPLQSVGLYPTSSQRRLRLQPLGRCEAEQSLWFTMEFGYH
jgi:hypothetical protein